MTLLDVATRATTYSRPGKRPPGYTQSVPIMGAWHVPQRRFRRDDQARRDALSRTSNGGARVIPYLPTTVLPFTLPPDWGRNWQTLEMNRRADTSDRDERVQRGVLPAPAPLALSTGSLASAHFPALGPSGNKRRDRQHLRRPGPVGGAEKWGGQTLRSAAVRAGAGGRDGRRAGL